MAIIEFNKQKAGLLEMELHANTLFFENMKLLKERSDRGTDFEKTIKDQYMSFSYMYLQLMGSGRKNDDSLSLCTDICSDWLYINQLFRVLLSGSSGSAEEVESIADNTKRIKDNWKLFLEEDYRES